MTRDAPPSPPGPDPLPEPDPDRPGRLGLTDPRTLIVLATVGVVVGWAVRPLTRALGWTTPTVTWLHVAGLALAGVIVLVTARRTRRSVRRRDGGLRAHEAVNRLMMGKSCALVGAFAAGAYVGAAISWIGALSELAGENAVRSLGAAAAMVLLLVAGLLLERACRVDDDPPAP